MKIGHSGKHAASARGLRIAVAVSDFNSPITNGLLAACLGTLRTAGVEDKDLRVVRVPGAFELPLACQALAKRARVHAVIALGCVIRGETPHDRYICHAVSQGIMRVSLDSGMPVIFGVLTTLDEAQARARAGAGDKNKGREAALAAIQSVTIMKGLR